MTTYPGVSEGSRWPHAEFSPLSPQPPWPWPGHCQPRTAAGQLSTTHTHAGGNNMNPGTKLLTTDICFRYHSYSVINIYEVASLIMFYIYQSKAIQDRTISPVKSGSSVATSSLSLQSTNLRKNFPSLSRGTIRVVKLTWNKCLHNKTYGGTNVNTKLMGKLMSSLNKTYGGTHV